MARTVSNCSAGEREVNDGSQFVLARNGSGTVTDEHGFYPGGDQPMSVRLPSGRTGVFITDPQLRSTVRAIADADKNATNMEFKTYSISPWGVVPADTGTTTRLRLAGQQYDQGSRLYFMRARYYDPDLGRFLSEDPIGISGGLNLYAYAGNDPVNMWDPSGLCLEPGGIVGSDDICVGLPGLHPFTPTFVPDALPPVGNRNGPPGVADFGGLFGDPSPASPMASNGSGDPIRTDAGPSVMTSGSHMNSITCMLATEAYVIAPALDALALYDGSRAVGRLLSGGLEAAVGSISRATVNLSGRGGMRRIGASVLLAQGQANITLGIMAAADVTSVSLVSQYGVVRQTAEYPRSLADLSLTLQAGEAYRSCKKAGY